MPGLFVTFEGLDGCGKTTQMRLLAERLRDSGCRVVETVEPGGTAIGQAIRAILLDPANHGLAPVAEMLLYFAARAQNVVELIEPALSEGAVVLSDRWTDSTWAYQGFGRDLGTEVVTQLDAIACRGRRPDLTLWIDVGLEASLRRAGERNREKAAAGHKDESRMDEQGHAFFAKVLQGYQRLAAAEPARVIRVDGHGTPKEVAERVWRAFQEKASARV